MHAESFCASKLGLYVQAAVHVATRFGAEATAHGHTSLLVIFAMTPWVVGIPLWQRSASTPPNARWPTRLPVVLLAAGGIADGRGVAAALMLGADGVLMGTRFWASCEALVHPGQMAAGLAASGDGTLRTQVVDIARGLDWPAPYDIRVLRNGFTDRWHDDPGSLRADAGARADWADAWENGNAELGNAIVGEGIGLIQTQMSAEEIIRQVVAQAEALLNEGWKRHV